MFRVGMGTDIHRLEEGRPLFLGGITLPFEKGLVGHSDGDCLIHALIDALLGAAGAGDIGRHFPDTDPAFRGIRSTLLLQETRNKLLAADTDILNVDAVVTAEKPRLSPHIPSMENRLAELIKIPPDRINIKAKTNEGMGEVGRGEAIAAQVVVLLQLPPREPVQSPFSESE